MTKFEGRNTKRLTAMHTDRLQISSLNGLRGRRAFTLTEVLVIIAVIVVVLAMAVPLFNVFSASRSVDGAETGDGGSG